MQRYSELESFYRKAKTDLLVAAKEQDEYDLRTTNLIAPASPTPQKYHLDIPLRHNAIAEGLLGHRPYAGAKAFNEIEEIASKVACRLFGADHANVQPHSVSQANQAVYQALLEHGDPVLAMKFDSGGHLTHGHPVNFSGRFYNFKFYGTDKNGYLDYEQIERMAREHHAKLIVCGASSYPRTIDFEKLGEISRNVGAYLMGDLSHPAGLIAANRFPQPFPHCDVVTLTPDKTMLGPHGGIVMCKDNLRQKIDKAVHPGVQSSVPLARIYQMAECFIDSGGDWFKDYIDRILKNIKVFEAELNRFPASMITGGSDTHLLVVDTLKTFGLTGKQAEAILENVGILTNRQVLPDEQLKPYVASGIRIGTTWITSRGYNESETSTVAKYFAECLLRPDDSGLQVDLQQKLLDLTQVVRENDVWQEL